jgi:hypothetical protein
MTECKTLVTDPQTYVNEITNGVFPLTKEYASPVSAVARRPAFARPRCGKAKRNP